MTDFIHTIQKAVQSPVGKRIFVLFFILLLGGYYSTQIIHNEFEEGCGSSPYDNFKAQYCAGENPEGIYRVNFRMQSTLVPISSVLRAGAIKVFPLYSASQITISPFFTNTNTASLQNKPSPYIFELGFAILDVVTLALTAILLTFLIQQKSAAGKIITGIILVLAYFWIVPVAIIVMLNIISRL